MRRTDLFAAVLLLGFAAGAPADAQSPPGISERYPGAAFEMTTPEAAGGQVVFHLHMHVMPRHDGVALLPPASRKEDVKVLEDNATKLVAALKGA